MKLKKLLKTSILILVFGIFMLLISIPILLRNIEIRNNSSEIIATVTYAGRRPWQARTIGSEASFMYVQYVVGEREYSTRVYFRPEGVFSVGDEVLIHYSLRNPSNARLADPFKMRYNPDLIFLVFGMLFMALSIWMFYWCIRTWKNDRVATKRITEFRRE